MAGKIRRQTCHEVETLLRKHGFTLVSQAGSHRKWRNLEKNLQVIVPFHKGKPLPIGTLTAILRGAKIPESEWRA